MCAAPEFAAIRENTYGKHPRAPTWTPSVCSAALEINKIEEGGFRSAPSNGAILGYADTVRAAVYTRKEDIGFVSECA
jgi:hypothetical protein